MELSGQVTLIRESVYQLDEITINEKYWYNCVKLKRETEAKKSIW
jgi:hypothetical protein